MTDIILGLDPSPKTTGWSTGEDNCGTIKDKDGDVIRMIHGISELIFQVKPVAVGIEDFGDQGRRIKAPLQTGRDMGFIIGAVWADCFVNGIPFFTWRSSETKTGMDLLKPKFKPDPGHHKFDAFCVWNRTVSEWNILSRTKSTC